jgi:hypothetical protein
MKHRYYIHELRAEHEAHVTRLGELRNGILGSVISGNIRMSSTRTISCDLYKYWTVSVCGS